MFFCVYIHTHFGLETMIRAKKGWMKAYAIHLLKDMKEIVAKEFLDLKMT